MERDLVNPSIADPVGQDIETFSDVFKSIQDEIKRILPFLLKEIKLFSEKSNIKV
jgi:hypothetical protein